MINNNKINLLIIEDEDFDVKRIKGTLTPFEHIIDVKDIVSSGTDALQLIKNDRDRFDVIIMDYQISGGLYGVELIRELKSVAPSVQIIIVTKMTLNQTDIDFAAKLIESGASWFGTKNPVDIEDFIYQPTDFILAIRNAYEKRQLQLEKFQLIDERDATITKLESSVQGVLSKKKIIGESAEIQKIKNLISKYANVNANILITGESGTGKELAATHLHYLSNRRLENFITVNCSAIPDSLFESELFGHMKGAFTDAKEGKIGLFEQADKGTLFLDEVGDLSLSAQAKLLRALETGEIEKIGRKKKHKVNIRIISATNKNLPEMVKENKFREDLFYRLNILNVKMPALRTRPEDVKLLIIYFLKEFSREHSLTVPIVSKNAEKFLMELNWYGNTRQLKNLTLRMLLLQDGEIDMEIVHLGLGDQISRHLEDSGIEQLNRGTIVTLKEAEQNFRKKYISAARALFNTDSETARHLGMAKSNFHRLLKELELK
jgi:DNA-binding NtrC family response regulator